MTDQDIQNMQDIFKSMGKELTKEQALEKLLALVSMMKIVWKPMTQMQLDHLQECHGQTGDLENN